MATSAASSGSPAGILIDGIGPPGDEKQVKEQWNIILGKQEEYLLKHVNKSSTSGGGDSSSGGSGGDSSSEDVPPMLLANDVKNFAKLVSAAYTEPSIWRGVTESAFESLKEYSSMPSMIKQVTLNLIRYT